MKVFAFHLMPYADLDLSYRDHHVSSWVNLPNRYYDPKKGHALYNRYLDELELCAELGFDGISVNEHHQTAYGLMPSPVVMASALARRTGSCKIAILGNAFCLREHPLTLAEEHAMLDNITGGRLITGMVRGIGAEYFSLASNPAFSHSRFQEAHDLIIRAWTETEPFAHEGRHFQFEYVNMWPRPYQNPHPPIWCPSTGSSETIDWASHPSRRYVYLQTYSPTKSVARYLNSYRETAERKHGYTASSDQIGWAAPIYVAETDEQAVNEARPHIEAFFNKYLNLTFEMLCPPGYLSASSMKNMRAHKSSVTGGSQTIEKLIDLGIMVCGSPDTVKKKLLEAHSEMGFQNFLMLPQFGTLPADLTEKNIRLFSKHILPELQSRTDREYKGMAARAA